ncbi:MAG: Formylglycine-generating enzyme, required for sulfatase activity, contains SUMF1/FGE domain [Candidatus Electronema aureum]|uniref:Formylglycine-generating enzyme, required for sulfatase activity, contains SUMF1/FGE domain n=1 Tax=Candidatus Electronema aureum TaxID=2005002 RepID=A0A521G447_9BACT|nr:MAG: Formylglycine-generating enzyme, required for sulfatase activity, contains SUMF1/FGE domain [Candidatus Electronema aureum]
MMQAKSQAAEIDRRDKMADEDKKKSFWETLPGVITAVGGLLVGVAAVIAALNEGATKENTPKAEPLAVLTANDAAEKRAAELERQLAEFASAKEQAQQEADAAKAELARVKAASAQVQAKAELKQGDSMNDDATGMKLAYVPSGCFMMGSSTDDEGHENDEGPVHKVCVDSFWMGQYEVTQGQWEKVMGANPSEFKKGGNYPVERVSWNDVQDFIKKLNSSSTGNSYRLPTEAEWEYACRANSSSRYCGGNDVNAVAWHGESISDGSTHPVGGKQANGFGLYDMSGNVWEWCADQYDSGYYASSPQSNPVGSESESYRVLRGGGWGSMPRDVRAANRCGPTHSIYGSGVGFRLVLPVKAL